MSIVSLEEMSTVGKTFDDSTDHTDATSCRGSLHPYSSTAYNMDDQAKQISDADKVSHHHNMLEHLI